MNKSRTAHAIVGFCLLLAAIPHPADAGLIRILADQDASIHSAVPDQNSDTPGAYLWVGHHDPPNDIYESMIGFDTSVIADLSNASQSFQLTRMTLNVFGLHLHSPGIVRTALGNTDTWDASTVTWNTSAGDHGPILDWALHGHFGRGTLPAYVPWDVSQIGLDPLVDNDYVTFYLFVDPVSGAGANFHAFEAENGGLLGGATSPAFLEIEYETAVSAVPEPSTAVLIGVGGMLLVGTRLRRRAPAARRTS